MPVDPLNDSVAIVGMSCRLPGAPDVAAFWQLLRDGRAPLTHFTATELLASGVPRRWIDDPAYVPAGMILDDIETFDAEFFGIPAREAEIMDPQQRLLLECAWEALEGAGYRAGGDARVAVYAGARLSDYMLFLQRPPDLFGTTEPAAEGFRRLLLNDKDYLATRLSHVLDLRGPAVTVQTACSTSLVAVHMACQSLLNGECDLALAGGASIRVPQRSGYVFSEGMIFSRDGHTRPFDARASGTVFGSGAGVVALKRLGDALADGDVIHAVIRGSAVNNDGAAGKAAFTAPSVEGQARVIAEALAVSGVEPGEVSYVEAHGTGTAVGDPIELAALAQAFRGAAPHTCAVGSVKGNVGHLIQAAGLAGLIKTALMLRHRTLVPTVNFEEPNPLIDFTTSPFFVNDRTRSWDSEGAPRRAGVSAFGFGGTNAHVIVEEAPTAPGRAGRWPAVPGREEATVLTLSAKSPEALRQLAARYVEQIRSEPEQPLRDICYASQLRPTFPHRAAFAVTSREEILRVGEIAPTSGEGARTLTFLYSGQGTQYANMGRALYDAYSVFHQTLDRCLALDGDLHETLFGSDSAERLVRTEFAQPALVAFQIALTTLWRSWGVDAQVVLGHSVGELSAAWAAGILTLEDALRFAGHRGRLMERAAPGLMAVVPASPDAVEALLQGSVGIAAINGPEQTIVSGSEADVSAFLAKTPGRVIGQYAFHSSRLDPILDELRSEAARLTFSQPDRTFVSTLTGLPFETTDWPTYWRRQSREPVRFAAAVAHATGLTLEIGADAVLTTLVALADGERPAGSRRDRISIASLRRGAGEIQQMATAAVTLYSSGIDIDWSATRRDDDVPPRRVDVPHYPFQRRRHWVSQSPAFRHHDNADHHPLLGARIPSPSKEIQFRAELTANVAPFARDHWIYGMRPLMIVGQLEMVRAAAGFMPAVVEDLVVEQPLLLEETPRIVQTIVTPTTGDALRGEGDAVNVRIFSSAGDEEPWTGHTAGRVRPLNSSALQIDLAAIRSRCARTITGEDIHTRKHANGATIGPAFDIVRCAWQGHGEVLVDVALTDEERGDLHRYGLHPGLLDVAAQCADLTLRADEQHSDLYLPTVIERAKLHAPLPERVWTHLRRRDVRDGDLYGVDATFADASGAVLVELEGFFFKRATPASLRRQSDETNEQTYGIHWTPIERGSGHDWRGTWLLAARDADALGKRIEELGGTVVVAGETYLRDALSLCRESTGPLSFITRGAQATGEETAPLSPDQALLWGLGRVLQNEQPDRRCRLIDLDPAGDGDVDALLPLIATAAESQMAIRGSRTFGIRLRPTPPGPRTETYRVEPGPERTVDDLRTIPSPRRPPARGEVEIEVHASGLNFRDVLTLTGRIDGHLGRECSGVVVACGDGVAHLAPGMAVMAIVPNALASHVTADARLVVRKPADLGFAAAAGTPIVFATAQYGLIERARLGPGMRVLIHTAAGGVGQAAIQVARLAGATVFATASRRKWDLVRAAGAEQVMDSRATGFAKEILAASGGRGVDVVLNTLGDEFLDENLAVLSPGGRLVDLGHPQIVDMARAAKRCAAAGVELINFQIAKDVGEGDPDAMLRLLTAVSESIERRELRPVPHRSFPLAEARGAFETILRGAHVGKLVIVHAPPAESSVRGDATYLITGGTGAVGLQVARTLADRGARHIAVLARRDHMSDALRDCGANVRVIPADVADAADVARALDEIGQSMPPLRGVIHAAGIVDDAVLSQLDWERAQAVLRPKVDGAWNLHRLTIDTPLDFFVMVSSAAGLWGNAGQASYAAANVFLDTLAHARRQSGLPATSIDYGLWRGEGMGSALDEATRRRRAANGLSDLDPAAAARAMLEAVAADRAQVGVFAVDWEKYLAQFPAGSVPAIFTDLQVDARADRVRPAEAVGAAPRSIDDARDRIRRHVAQLTNATLTDADAAHSLPDLGLDSLAVLLLRGRLATEFGEAGALPVLRYLEGHSIARLAELIWERRSREPVVTATPADTKWLSLTPLKREGTRAPLLLVPPSGRSAMRVSPLAASMVDHPVFGMHPIGFEGTLAPHDTIEAMASHYVGEYLSAFPGRACVVGGLCFGAVVALEMALQLTDRGVEVPLVVVIDNGAPFLRPAERKLTHMATYYAQRIGQHLRHRSLRSVIQQRVHNIFKRRELELGAAASDGHEELASASQRLLDAHSLAWLRYRARRYRGDLLLIESEENHRHDASGRWSLVVDGTVDSVVFPGTTHLQLISNDYAPILARTISEKLASLR